MLRVFHFGGLFPNGRCPSAFLPLFISNTISYSGNKSPSLQAPDPKIKLPESHLIYHIASKFFFFFQSKCTQKVTVMEDSGDLCKFFINTSGKIQVKCIWSLCS